MHQSTILPFIHPFIRLSIHPFIHLSIWPTIRRRTNKHIGRYTHMQLITYDVYLLYRSSQKSSYVMSLYMYIHNYYTLVLHCLLHTVDGCEVQHQLICGKHPMFYRVQPSKVLQDGSRYPTRPSRASTVQMEARAIGVLSHSKMSAGKYIIYLLISVHICLYIYKYT